MTSVDLVRRLSSCPGSDECYTPSGQVAPLLKYLDKSLTYYEATSGKSSSLLDGFVSSGWSMVGSNGRDFFDCGPDDVFDGVVTNPPYSLKDKFIEHCYLLGKPFALLLPVAAFQGNKRGKMFIERGMSAVVYNSRVDFTGKGSPPFGVAWFIHGFIPPNRVYWEDNKEPT